MIIIFKSQQYCFQRYVIIQVIRTRHQPKFHQLFVRKIDQEFIWDFCVIMLLYPVFAHNLIKHFISFEELSCVDCQKVVQCTIKNSQYVFTNKPSRVIEIIGIQNDAIHEPEPGHQLFLWQNAVSYLYILDYQRVNISLGSILERFHTGDDQRWIIVRSEVLWNAGSCHQALFHSLWSRRSYTNIANRK